MTIPFFYSILLLSAFFLFQIRYTLGVAFTEWELAQYLILFLLLMFFILCFINFQHCKNTLKAQKTKPSPLEADKQKILSMDPYDLSKLINKLFKTTSPAKVYSTPKKEKPFYDIEMNLVDEKVIISCFLTEKEPMITQAYLNRLYNLMQANQVSQGAFITLGDFSDDCYDFIKDKPIHLINGNELVDSLRLYSSTT